MLRVEQTVKRLMNLVRFYNIIGHEHWEESIDNFTDNPHDISSEISNSSSESDDSSSQKLSLEDAIRKYPLRALEELATCVGIVFENILNFHANAAEHRERDMMQAAKRPLATVDLPRVEDETRLTKKSKPQSLPESTSHVALRPLQRSPPQPTKPSPSSSSAQTRLDWDAQANKQVQEFIRDKMEAVGSPTEAFTLSQDSRKTQRTSGKKGSNKGSIR
jgi:hypothetical protein